MGSNWKIPTALICAYGFFKEMKPSEPFLTPYLNSTHKHLSIQQLSSQVYPVWTYSYLVVLFIVFIITDVLRYKPLVITEALAYLTTRILLIWGDGVLAMQFMQIAYGIATGTEIAYYSYIYALVSNDHYQKVTGYTRAIVLAGRAMAGIVGQLLISFHATSYLVLNYISLISVSIACIISLFLPKAIGNIFQTEEISSAVESNADSQGNVAINNSEASLKCQNCGMSLKTMFIAFKESYRNKTLLQWSIWWSLAMCGYLQVGNYVQNLWEDIQGQDKNKVVNGGIEAAATLGGAVVAFLLSFIRARWTVIREMLLGMLSLLDAVLLYMMARTGSIWVAYTTYIGYRLSYTFLITIASFHVALHVELSRFALIFGWNTFVALILQTILTFIVTDKRGLDLRERDQFVIYGGYYAAIGLIFLATPMYRAFRRCHTLCRLHYNKRNTQHDMLEETESEDMATFEDSSQHRNGQSIDPEDKPSGHSAEVAGPVERELTDIVGSREYPQEEITPLLNS